MVCKVCHNASMKACTTNICPDWTHIAKALAAAHLWTLHLVVTHSQLSATAECVQRRRRAVGLLHKLPAFIQPSPTHHPLPASSFAQLQLSFMEVTNPLVVTHLGRHPPALQLEKHPRHVHRQQKCTPVSHELIRGCTRAHWPHIYAHCTWPGCICDW